MRNLYSIHDYTNLKMGFVPYTGSKKKDVVLASGVPTTSYPSVSVAGITTTFFGLSTTEFIIVACGVAILVGIAVLIYLLCF